MVNVDFYAWDKILKGIPSSELALEAGAFT